MRKQNFDPDENQNRTAQNTCLSRHAGTAFLAEKDSDKTENKGDGSDEQDRPESLQNAVIGDGEAHRKGVNGGSQPLKQQQCDPGLPDNLFLPFVSQRIDQHLAADETQQKKGDPGNKTGKTAEILQGGVDQNPAGHGHQRLKKGKHPRNSRHLGNRHGRLGQPVGQGDRKGIHGQPRAQKQTSQDKQKNFQARTNPSYQKIGNICIIP